MQELCDSTEKPNMNFMGIEEAEEVEARGIGNIFNNIIAEKLPKSHETDAYPGTGDLYDFKVT
jgi:hypothetical protein